MIQNYDKIFEKITSQLADKKRLLLHACCAPCSSSVLERVTPYFDVSLYFYNPNVTSEEEYILRLNELKRFVGEVYGEGVKVINGDYDTEKFYALSKGREELPEGGARCKDCYGLRLRETARRAKEGSFDYFCTTLSVSPYKNAEYLNAIGEGLQGEFGVPYLFSDFKKKQGYVRSIELSKEYGLYRQNYCGCAFSEKLSKKETD